MLRTPVLSVRGSRASIRALLTKGVKGAFAPQAGWYEGERYRVTGAGGLIKFLVVRDVTPS